MDAGQHRKESAAKTRAQSFASRVARVLYGGKRKELEEHILVQIGRSNLRDVQGCMKVHGLERPTQAVERLGWQAQSDSLG